MGDPEDVSDTVPGKQRLASAAEVDFERNPTSPDDTLFDVDEPTPGTPESSDLPEDTPVGEYLIQSKIGHGAMGTVYRAIHPEIGKVVAIKVINPRVFEATDAVKRFVAEARAVAAIGHPGIVHVFGFGRLTDTRMYLTMEWLEGESLGARIERGRIPLFDALDIVRQITRALEAAHAKDIIHRDLKPDNVFLQHVEGEPPIVKLLDFGLAKVIKRDDMLVARTRTGQMLGTPLYMSPEQCRAKNVDHRTDIYALGCMCYQMLAGRVPFDHDNTAELISAHLTQEPPRPRSLDATLPRELDTVLPKLIAKDPGARPTLADLRRTIVHVTGSASSPMIAVSPKPDPEPQTASTPKPEAEALPPRRAPLVLAVLAGGAAVALVILVWSVLRSSEVTPTPPAAGSAQPALAAPPPAPAPVVAPADAAVAPTLAVDAAVAPADAVPKPPTKPKVPPKRQGSEQWTPDSPFLPN